MLGLIIKKETGFGICYVNKEKDDILFEHPLFVWYEWLFMPC